MVRAIAWAKPAMFLLVLIGLWDVAIRVFHVPPYLVPTPLDVIRTLIADWRELLQQAVPTTTATLLGFAASAAFPRA